MVPIFYAFFIYGGETFDLHMYVYLKHYQKIFAPSLLHWNNYIYIVIILDLIVL